MRGLRLRLRRGRPASRTRDSPPGRRGRRFPMTGAARTAASARRSTSSPVDSRPSRAGLTVPRRGAAPSAAQAIITAVDDLARTRGWSATTMSDVAAAAGVSRQTVYNEFGTRQALVAGLRDPRDRSAHRRRREPRAQRLARPARRAAGRVRAVPAAGLRRAGGADHRRRCRGRRADPDAHRGRPRGGHRTGSRRLIVEVWPQAPIGRRGDGGRDAGAAGDQPRAAADRRPGHDRSVDHPDDRARSSTRSSAWPTSTAHSSAEGVGASPR